MENGKHGYGHHHPTLPTHGPLPPDVAALVNVAQEIRNLGKWSATEDGDLVLTCPDGSTEISYLANRAAVVARALTALGELQ